MYHTGVSRPGVRVYFEVFEIISGGRVKKIKERLKGDDICDSGYYGLA